MTPCDIGVATLVIFGLAAFAMVVATIGMLMDSISRWRNKDW